MQLSRLAMISAALAAALPALAAEPLAPLPAAGGAKLAAYAVCRSTIMIDMGPVGSNSSAECTGVVKTRDGAKPFDNLAIRCMEESKARPQGYAFTGTCIQTDMDGDKLFMIYKGPETGTLEWIGGTGKYEHIAGKGTWSVADAPGNTPQLFAFTLTMDVAWETKAK